MVNQNEKRILIHLRSWFRARDAQITITPSFAFNSQNTYFRTHDLVNIKDRHLNLVSFETLLRVEAKLTRILIHLRSWFRARDAQVTITPSFAFNSQNTYFRTHDLVNIKDRRLNLVSFETLLRVEAKLTRILIHLRSWFRARDAQVTITPTFAFNSQNTYFRTHDLVNIKDRHLNLVSFEKHYYVVNQNEREFLIHLRSCFRARDAQITITPTFAFNSQNTYFRNSWSGLF